MGFFDLFRAKSESTAKPESSSQIKAASTVAPERRRSQARRHAPAIDKRAKEHDRQGAIEALAKLGTEEAASVLVRRFRFDTEPSITDRDEKQRVFEALVAIGDDAIPALLAECARGERQTWALRALRRLLDADAYVEEVLALLDDWENEYVRDAEPKVELLAGLAVVKDPRIATAVERFLDDVHEPTRFQAVGTLLAQGDPAARAILLRARAREEAARIVDRITRGLAA